MFDSNDTILAGRRPGHHTPASPSRRFAVTAWRRGSPPEPPRPGTGGWFDLLAYGRVVAYGKNNGYWPLYALTNNSDIGEQVGEEMGDGLAELAAASLTILDRHGEAMTTYL